MVQPLTKSTGREECGWSVERRPCTRDQPALAWSLESNRATPKLPPTAGCLLVAVIIYFLLGVAIYWGAFRTSSANQRRPLDPRIVGTWAIQENAEWNGTYHDRTLIFSPNGHYVFSASRDKDGETNSETYSGEFYFLDGDVVEFTGGGVVKMRVGWLSDDEIILAGASGSLLYNHEKETLLTGTLKRIKTDSEKKFFSGATGTMEPPQREEKPQPERKEPTPDLKDSSSKPDIPRSSDKAASKRREERERRQQQEEARARAEEEAKRLDAIKKAEEARKQQRLDAMKKAEEEAARRREEETREAKRKADLEARGLAYYPKPVALYEKRNAEEWHRIAQNAQNVATLNQALMALKALKEEGMPFLMSELEKSLQVRAWGNVAYGLNYIDPEYVYANDLPKLVACLKKVDSARSRDNPARVQALRYLRKRKESKKYIDKIEELVKDLQRHTTYRAEVRELLEAIKTQK